MSRGAVVVACAGVLCLATATVAPAEPIDVLSGSLVFPTGDRIQLGPLSLVGTRGFSVLGAIDTGENNVGPFSQCSPCAASATLDIGGPSVSDSGFFDTNVTFEGHTFVNIGGTGGENGDLVLQLAGTVFVPAVGPSPIVLTAPFVLSGSVLGPRNAFEVPIRGGGLATVRLAPQFGLWELQGVRYDFVPTPTPEPATLVLMSGALAGGALRARRRRTMTSYKENL
jgi:PEP-CTERM motif